MNEHPGAVFYTKYASFTDLCKRDRWFRKLDPIDRDFYLAYRTKLRATLQGRAA